MYIILLREATNEPRGLGKGLGTALEKKKKKEEQEFALEIKVN